MVTICLLNNKHYKYYTTTNKYTKLHIILIEIMGIKLYLFEIVSSLDKVCRPFVYIQQQIGPTMALNTYKTFYLQNIDKTHLICAFET